MIDNKIEQLYLKWLIFITTTVFLLSVFGIYWRFDQLTVSISLLLSAAISFYVPSSHFIKVDKDNNRLAIIALIIFLIQISSTFLVSFIPTFTYDEIAYSVSLPKHYVAAQQFYYVDNYGAYSAFPQNYETLTSVSLLFFNSPVLAKVINYILGFGMVIVANRMAIQCGVSNKVSILAGIFVGCSTAFIISLPIAKNDILNGFFQVWAIVILVTYYRNKSVFLAGMVGALIGSAIGTKYNSIIFSIIPISAFITITHFSSMPIKDKLQRYFALTFFIILAAFPWYLRNFIEFQNPFYPALNQIFLGKNLFNQIYINVFNEIFFHDIVDFTWDTGTIFTFFKKHIHSFGAVVSVLGFLGVCLSLTHKLELRFTALVLIAITVVTLRYGFWEPRYNIFLLVMISVFAAFFCDEVFKLVKKNYHQFNINIALITLAVLFGALGFFRGAEAYKTIEHSFLFKRTQFLEANVPYWKVANFLNLNTPKNSKIGVGFGGNQMFYYLDRPYYHFHPMTEKGDLLSKNTPNDFLSLINLQNIEYMAISNCCSYGHVEGKTPMLSVFMKHFYESITYLTQTGKIEKIAEIGDVIIYKIISAETK